MASSRQNIIDRRKRLQTQMPGHYCPVCTAVTFEEEGSCSECGSERPSGTGWPALRDSLDPWLGRILDGRYLLTKRIGQGASASVYRAESLAISRQFAIKIIHPAKSSNGPSPEQITARLEREIEALGRLRNPHVVRFYDVIELPLNHIGVVMDFVEGDTLEELVTYDGALEPERAIAMVRQLANGLYEAHLMGLVHRDLKPENIMVERLPAGDDFVHVLDFGIVHLDDQMTMTQGFIGTPLYASPEQAMGEPVDHRSDIYSLGAILFYMLAGRPPFVGNHVMQVLRHHVETPPPSLLEARPGLPAGRALEALVNRMLAKSLEDRPQDLAEIIHALDRATEMRRSAAYPTVNRTGGGAPDILDSEDLYSETEIGAGVSSTRPEGFLAPPQTKEERQRALDQERITIDNPPAPKSGVIRRPNFEREPSAVERLGEIDLPDDVDLSLFACATDFRVAFVHRDVLHVYDTRSGDKKLLPLQTTPEITAFALGADSVLLGRADGALERVELSNGRLVRLFESVFSDVVADVAMSPDGRLMLAAMRSGRIYMSPVNKDERDWVRIRAGSRVDSMTLSPRGDLFAVAREHGEIEVSRIGEPKQVRARISINEPVVSMAFSEDGYLLGLSTHGSAIGLFQVINGMHLVDVNTSQNTPLSFFFSNDNNLMGYLSEEQRLYVADLQSLARKRQE